MYRDASRCTYLDDIELVEYMTMELQLELELEELEGELEEQLNDCAKRRVARH